MKNSDKNGIPPWKKWSKRLLLGLTAVYVLLAIDKLTATDRSTRCPAQERSLNGQKYDIEFCLWGGDRYHEYMHLRVFSKSGELLAARGATFQKESLTNYMVIDEQRIRYSDYQSDDSRSQGCVLQMPPSKLDWLEARLPGGIPGVNHCHTVGDAEFNEVTREWELQEAERQKQREETSKSAQNAHP